jgi:hypothetical protein
VRAVSTMASAGTPVIASVASGVIAAQCRRRCSNTGRQRTGPSAVGTSTMPESASRAGSMPYVPAAGS